MFPYPTPLRFRPRREFLLDDDGMSTVEYCVGLIAAAALAVVLYGIVTGDDVLNSITSIVQRALTVQV
jgi:Flp pilus assembly pilin Flp